MSLFALPSHSGARLALLCFLASFALLAAQGTAVCATPDEVQDRPSALPGYTMGDLRKLAASATRTGVGRDAIPALSKPQYVTVSDASLSLDDDDIVFLVQYPNGVVHIFPQRIMVWHEVVNDMLPDADGNVTQIPGFPGDARQAGYVITYSPLTGTVAAFRALVNGRYPTGFGVSGDLLNSNSVLYDHISGSLWSQLPGVCMEGPFLGKRLERYPVLWATWKGVKERYTGKARVLSSSTGYKRPYGRDPYGSYREKGGYYENARVIYPLSRLDERLPPKKRILGIELDSLFGAVRVDAVRESRVLNFTLGVVPLVAIYDAQLDAVRIFDRRPGRDEQALSFAIFEDRLVDQQTKSQWTAEGVSYYGKLRDTRLAPVLAVDAMWFAWSAFYRDTDIFPYNDWKPLSETGPTVQRPASSQP